MTQTLLAQRFREEAEKTISKLSDGLCDGSAQDWPDYRNRVGQIKAWKAALAMVKRIDREVLGLPEEKD